MIRVFLWVAAVVLLSACESRRYSKPGLGRQPDVQAEDLRDDLMNFEDFAEQRIVSASNEVYGLSTNRKSQAAALRWKSSSFEAMREHIYQDDPVTALLETWSYFVRMRSYLESGEGSSLFGRHQQAAVEAAISVETAISEISSDHLPSEDLREIEKFITEFAENHPMKGIFDDSNAEYEPLEESQSQLLANLVSLPFSPLLTFSKVNKTADSIAEFNRISARIADIMEDMPRETRWQMELLLLDFQNSENVLTVVESLDRVSRDFEKLRTIAERTPELAEESAGRVLGQIAEAQDQIEELRGLTGDLALASTALRDALQDGRELSTELQDTARAWTETSQIVRRVLSDIDALKSAPAAGSSSDAEPFRISDYRDTATELRTAATELRLLLEDVQEVRSAPVIDKAREDTAALIDASAKHSRDVIDHAFRRAVQVIVIAGLVVAALILLGWLLRKKKGQT